MVSYNNGVVVIKKPISPNFDHSNRFPTDYIPQTLHSLMPILPQQELRDRLLVTHFVSLLNVILNSFTKYFVSRGVFNMIRPTLGPKVA